MGYEILIFLTTICIIIVFFQQLNMKRISNTMNRMYNMRKVLYEVADAMIKLDKEEEIYASILKVSMRLIPHASKGSVLILENDKFKFKALEGYPEELKEICLDNKEVFINRTSKSDQSMQSIIIKNPASFDKIALKEEKVKKLLEFDALDISCTISSPLYIDNRLIGLLNIDSTDYNYVFTEEDREFMNYIKNELQLVLKNSFAQNTLRYLANYDELTQIYNRRCFKKVFEMQINDMKENKEQGAVILIDIDNFKAINDTFGHNIGDAVLKKFAEALKNIIKFDGIYGRMSGDEFIVFFRNCSKEEASKKIEKLRRYFQKEKIKICDIELKFTYGIYLINYNYNKSYDDILIHVDKDMYKNKRYKNTR